MTVKPSAKLHKKKIQIWHLAALIRAASNTAGIFSRSTISFILSKHICLKGGLNDIQDAAITLKLKYAYCY